MLLWVLLSSSDAASVFIITIYCICFGDVFTIMTFSIHFFGVSLSSSNYKIQHLFLYVLLWLSYPTSLCLGPLIIKNLASVSLGTFTNIKLSICFFRYSLFSYSASITFGAFKIITFSICFFAWYFLLVTLLRSLCRLYNYWFSIFVPVCTFIIIKFSMFVSIIIKVSICSIGYFYKYPIQYVSWRTYRQLSDIRRTQSQNINVSRLVL